jgi:hypothetical protein
VFVGDVVSVLMWVMLVWLVMFAIACVVAVITLRRTNRVVRSVPTDAPITWLVSLSRPARLHRQLRNLGTWMERTANSAHSDAWNQLINEVVATDARLVVAARANTRVRSAGLDAIEATVRRLEDLATRLGKLNEARQWPSQPTAPSDALEVLEHRIENLEAAHVDLADLERRFRSDEPASSPAPGNHGSTPTGSAAAPPPPSAPAGGTSSDIP